jgi:prefoldin subunit 5
VSFGVLQVVEAIDTMVTNLGEEQQSDDDQKEMCEEQRAKDTRASVLAGRAIDEASDAISSLTADIEELDNRIKQKNDELTEIAQQLASAKAQREEESARFAKDQKDDQDAADTVGQAITVMEAFYKENNLMLAQQKAKEPVEVSAGQAPPPPPKTWEEPEYGGRTRESGGILTILKMIKDDIEADKEKGKQEEADAQKMYDETKKSLETSQADLGKQVDEMTITKGDKVTSMEDTVGERRLKKDELVGIMEKIKSVQPGCDFFLVNYKVRKAKRTVEKEGLVKAKAILQGAKFDAKDPEREIKPGDAALLVKARQHLQSLETRHTS